ncbi:MAG: glycosyltransferase family 39 protein [Acidimicrobiales bacterium]|nr:glycosyltransferase family 39 protein [Acidimicrobiales bacterium]
MGLPTVAPKPPPRRRELRASARRGVYVLAIVAFLGLGLQQAGRDAPTVDEGVDVSSGVSALVKHDLRMVPEHPVLPRALAALPALAAHPIVPETEAWERGDWFDWSDDFVSANAEAGRLDDVLLYARGVVLLEAVGCALLIGALATRWFGPDGGLLAAVGWLATPYVVGIGHFAMLDVPFTLAALGVALLAARWRDVPSAGRLVALAVALGAALATRHTSIALAALVVALVLEHHRRDLRSSARDVGILAVGSVGTLWLVYRGLSPGGSPGEITASFEGLISDVGSGSALVKLIGALPLPVAWRAGFAYLDLTSTDRPSSLLGRSWDGGAWWFFPVSAAIKVPLGIVLGIVGGWAVAVRRATAKRDLVRFVVAPGLVLWLFLVAQPLNLGLRLALPSLAFAYVGLGALPSLVGEDLRSARHRVGVAAIGTVLVVAIASSVVATPHSLAWTPWPFTPGYRWVSDSNIDAGQALYEVREWASGHDRPYVALDTTRGMEVGGGSRSLTQVAPEAVRGWVAVGVTPLMQTRRDDTVWADPESDPPPGFSLAWLRKYCPVGTLGGGSVLVYRFDEAPDPAPGPERPVVPCFGAASSRLG